MGYKAKLFRNPTAKSRWLLEQCATRSSKTEPKRLVFTSPYRVVIYPRDLLPHHPYSRQGAQ
jgi:hypothetical protein